MRANAIDTHHLQDDVVAVVQRGLHIINLPEPQSQDAIRAASQAIADVEKANGSPYRLG